MSAQQIIEVAVLDCVRELGGRGLQDLAVDHLAALDLGSDRMFVDPGTAPWASSVALRRQLVGGSRVGGARRLESGGRTALIHRITITHTSPSSAGGLPAMNGLSRAYGCQAVAARSSGAATSLAQRLEARERATTPATAV